MNLLESWTQAKGLLLENIGKPSYEAWINRLSAHENSPGVLCLSAPDEFSKEWVRAHYSGTIESILKDVTRRPVRIEFSIQEEAPPNTAALPAAGSHPEKTAASPGLNPRYTFNNFVVGPSNRFSHAAAMAVSESPAKVYNPLFIYGGVGLGKTHLMQAICHAILERGGRGVKICYIPSEKFTNELIDAIQHHSTARFRQKYRGVDVLVIDDVHFIAGKESTQEEFFHTFNTLYDAHKQIIISSDRIPKDISNLEDRLVSRFEWGLVTDIQPPDFETRVAILKKKIEHEPTPIPNDVLFFIAQSVKTNIRELEGALIRVLAYSLLENKPISLELTREVLKDFVKENNKTIGIDLIQKEVGAFFNLAQSEIKGSRRGRNVVFARQVAMYLSRELTDFSLPEIGGFFGGKDHTTVLHSYNKIKSGLVKDIKMKADIERIIQNIKQ
ncbi:chromosomal replication initiator protein DnaA [bacterium]|nr:MAG: chromosomal replication initiator protein DnaA [bacterium]